MKNHTWGIEKTFLFFESIYPLLSAIGWKLSWGRWGEISFAQHFGPAVWVGVISEDSKARERDKEAQKTATENEASMHKC